MIKKYILPFFLCLIMIISLIGCTASSSGSNPISPVESTKRAKLITQNEFFNTFSLFNSRLPEGQNISSPDIQKELYETGSLLSLTVEGDSSYIVSWIDGGRVLIFFKTEGEKKVPLYMDIGPIKSVKLLSDRMENDTRLIEVTYFGGSGSAQRENVKIYAVNGDTVTQAWDYDTFISNSHPIEEKKIFEFIIETSSFSYLPTYYSNPAYDEDEGMRILVNKTIETINTPSDDLEKVVSNKKVNMQQIFIWDSNQMKFIE